MAEKPLSFEQLKELRETEKSDIFFKIENFIHDLKNKNIGIIISYKDEILYQRVVKDGIAIVKQVRFHKNQISNKPKPN